MNKLLLCVLCLLAVFAVVAPCFADTVNGVLAEERIVNLPQDQGKWYVSVVGNATDTRYNEIVGWFDTNASLKKLKNQVHFCPVTSDTATYQARYACECEGSADRADAEAGWHRGLRGRRQEPSHDGGRAERCAGQRRSTASKGFVRSCLGDGKWSDGALVPCPNPQPNPQPQPDPEPQPIDDNGPPNVEPDAQAELPLGALALVCVAGVGVGMAGGYGRKLYDEVEPAREVVASRCRVSLVP